MEKKRILLIHPEISRTKYNFVGVIENECLELEYISTILKEEGHEIFLYDGQIEGRLYAKKIEAYDPDVVYVCGRTRQENFMLEYCKIAKAVSPDIMTVIGGLHAQLCYERMYAEYVDYILTSFDVFKIKDMMDAYFNGDNSIFLEMKDICFKIDGEWRYNGSEPFDINKLPLPDRSYFYEHPDNYRYLELTHAAWVRTAYSCPYRCAFCHRNRMNSSRYSARDIVAVVDEIEKIDANNIYIVDDDFLFNRNRLLRFVELIKERNINKTYICYGRADFISENEDIMAMLKEIGLYYVLTGLETTSDECLDKYNKKSNMNNNEIAIEICQRLGINMMAMFILDLDFSGKDFRDMYKWIKRHKLRHVAVSIYTPELGMEIIEEYRERLITDNPSHWDYLHVVAKPGKMSIKRYYYFYYTMLIKLFLRAWRQGVYSFLDYGSYIRSFASNLFKGSRENDNE